MSGCLIKCRGNSNKQSIALETVSLKIGNIIYRNASSSTKKAKSDKNEETSKVNDEGNGDEDDDDEDEDEDGGDLSKYDLWGSDESDKEAKVTETHEKRDERKRSKSRSRSR